MAEANEIILVGPNGEGETTVSTAAAFVNLVYGRGYVPQGVTIEEAYARLVPQEQG